MRADGLSDEKARAQLKAKSFSKSRISQLFRAVPQLLRAAPQEKKRATLHDWFGEAPKKRGPPITADELRQLGEASALEAARQFSTNGSCISARLSCQYVGVSTGPHTYSSAAQPLRNSTLVFAWRLSANGLERAALAKKSARCDALAKYVPLPEQLKTALEIETHYGKVQEEARREFPGLAFNLRLGVPRKLEPPPHLYAPGAAVMIRLPSGRRVEHVLCAHISGDLWYCHAGSPKEGDLHSSWPFRTTDLVVQSLARVWYPRQRKRLKGRCVKRDLAAAAAQHGACFEPAVAMARWRAEAYRAKERKAPMNFAAATAGVDFSEEAFKAAAAKPWTSTVLAVWQWAADAPMDRPHTHLCPDIQVCYAIRKAQYRSFRDRPRGVIPSRQSVRG